MQAFQRPPRTLPRVPEGRPGHEKNWLDAIRQKGQAVSHFDYAGPFTETVLLGNVALRYPGQRLLWDTAPEDTNMADADQYVRHTSVGCAVGATRRSGRRGSDVRFRLLSCVPMHQTSTAGSGSREPRELGDLRHFSHEAMNTVFEVYAAQRRCAIRGAGGAGGLRPRDRSSRRRVEPLPTQQRHQPPQSPHERRERTCRRGRARMPPHRPALI